MSRPARYILTDADVVLELTHRQLRVLNYVLWRAAEDHEFFAALAGTADSAATATLRSTLTQLLNRTNTASEEGPG